MRIVEVERYPISLGATKNRDKNDGGPQAILVRIRTDSTLVGLGEASSDPRDASRSMAALDDWLRRYGQALVGSDPLNINALHSVLDQVTQAGGPGSLVSRGAIDTAVHDLVGKARGCPVHELLGGAYRTEFELVAHVCADEADVAEAARSAVGVGFRAVRVGINGGSLHGATEVEKAQRTSRDIASILDAVNAEIYVEAHGQQSLGSAGQACALFNNILASRHRHNLSVIQPLNLADLKGHAFLRDKLPIPVVLDASVTSPEAMIEIVRLGAADRIILDVQRVGGLQNAMRIADICEAAAVGISPASGAHTMIGDAAVCHLAAAVHGQYPIALGEAFGFSDAPVRGLRVSGGHAILGNVPGLGVELDVERLEALATTT